MVNFTFKKWPKKNNLIAFIFSLIASNSFGAAINLPFNTTMQMLQSAISGPLLLSVAVIMIVVTCVMLAFGEWGDGFKRIINIVLWLSVAFAATGFVTTMFGGNGAVF